MTTATKQFKYVLTPKQAEMVERLKKGEVFFWYTDGSSKEGLQIGLPNSTPNGKQTIFKSYLHNLYDKKQLKRLPDIEYYQVYGHIDTEYNLESFPKKIVY